MSAIDVVLGCRDVCAHRGTYGEQYRQQAIRLLVVDGTIEHRMVEVGVGDDVGFVTQSACPQVHHEECEVVEDVGRGKFRVELQAVERNWLAVDDRDVPEMQIAVTVAHASAARPIVEKLAILGDESGDSVGELLCHNRFDDLRERRHTREVSVDDLLQSLRPLRIRTDLRSLMQFDDAHRQALQQVVVEATRMCVVDHQCVVVEARHLQDVVDDLARAVERERTVGGASDRVYRDVETGSEAPIEPQFGVESCSTPLRRAEVEVAQPNRAFELPGAIAVEHNHRAVRDDASGRGVGVEGTDLCQHVLGRRRVCHESVPDSATVRRYSPGGRPRVCRKSAEKCA